MALKPCLLAGLFVVALAGDSVANRLQAQSLYDNAAPIVVAQNDQGFFGRIFNRSNKSSDAKPLFLNKPGIRPQSSGARDPYEFKGQASNINARNASNGPSQWDRLMQEINERTEQDFASARRETEMQNRQMEAERLAAAKEGQNATAPKKLVYDPARVWTYNSNKRASEETPSQPAEEPQPQRRSRIYNSR